MDLDQEVRMDQDQEVRMDQDQEVRMDQDREVKVDQEGEVNSKALPKDNYKHLQGVEEAEDLHQYLPLLPIFPVVAEVLQEEAELPRKRY
jgi:hypothetical protein